jgi:SAM-dependent methyltransferase
MSDESAWVTLNEAIRAQLALQVDLSFERHHGFMAEHGLAECRTVVDLGTGDGNFLGRVAERHPGIRFIGIDDKPNMVEAAKSAICSNAEWVLADALDAAATSLLRAADGILMRYFLLHLPDTEAALAHILMVMRPGARLWVFDLDMDYTRCEPPAPAFDLLQNLVRDFCRANRVEMRTGSRVPATLDGLGWDVREVSVEPFNSREIDPGRLAEYLYREAVLYHHFIHGHPGTDALQGLKAFLYRDMWAGKHLVQYGMVMVSAEKGRA